MKKKFFFIASVIMLFLALIAFSDNLIFDIRQESNSDPKFIVHGLFMYAWFIFLVIQTSYIKKKNYYAHMKLGIFGMLSAVGVFVSTLMSS